MTTAERAVATFNNNFNCAQSVLSAFSEKYGLDQKAALKLASGLGSGLRAGEVCGVVSGAVLVIGLKYGQSEPADLESKRNCNAKTEEFIRAFRKRYGGIQCREILGCDISTPEGRDKAMKENLFRTVCAEKVGQAVELLEELGY